MSCPPLHRRKWDGSTLSLFGLWLDSLTRQVSSNNILSSVSARIPVYAPIFSCYVAASRASFSATRLPGPHDSPPPCCCGYHLSRLSCLKSAPRLGIHSHQETVRDCTRLQPESQHMSGSTKDQHLHGASSLRIWYWFSTIDNHFSPSGHTASPSFSLRVQSKAQRAPNSLRPLRLQIVLATADHRRHMLKNIQ